MWRTNDWQQLYHVHYRHIHTEWPNRRQEIWANAHETRHSISLIPYAGCLGLQYISAKNHSKCASQPKIAKKSLKTHILGVQGRSRSSMLVPPKARQQWLLWYAASLCLSVTILVLDWTTVAEIARLQGGTQIVCARTEDSLNLRGRNLHC